MPINANKLREVEDYEKLILDELKKRNYRIRDAKTDYNATLAMDKDILLEYLKATQPEKIEKLSRIYKYNLDETIINTINKTILSKNGSLIDAFRNGIEFDNGTVLRLYSPKPETSINKKAAFNWKQNIYSAMKEVYHTDGERIDIVIFLNGLAIFAFELKCNTSNQNIKDAVNQYMNERDSSTRLFMYKKGVLASFAMDLNEVELTTRLNGKSTFFLPFNKGDHNGKGNPHNPTGINVSYMWEDILTPDTLDLIISHLVYISIEEKRDADSGKITYNEKLIFPRYHQLRAVRKVRDDILQNHTDRNYLIKHSAGSGKTNTIAWLSRILSSLHDSDNKCIFDSVFIITDRIVVDRQLQDAVKALKPEEGTYRLLDDSCKSEDLKEAIEEGTNIIVTTIHKFFYILKEKLFSITRNRHYAVLIDEAHQSTQGTLMESVTTVLGGNEGESQTLEDKIVDEIGSAGKQPNVTMIAFTATPKPNTLQLFGALNEKGEKEEFDLYSMKQAIEEGFILNVLDNYVTYKTFFEINKKIEDDPEMKTLPAKKKILSFIREHPENIAQKVAIIVEHFRENIAWQLDGKAKAMVVTSSIISAIEYRQAFDDYIRQQGYTDVHALVAFEGAKKFHNETYTEVAMNGGIKEEALRYEFDKSCYQVLIVANKYQTGYDQPKLCAMYVDKKLSGVSAVQTLSRLNRTCYPYKKQTFILDFVNDYDDIRSAFEDYYENNVLEEPLRPIDVRNIYSAIEKYDILVPKDVEVFNSYLYQSKRSNTDKSAMWSILDKSLRKIEIRPQKDQKEIRSTINKFLKSYSFLIQATCYENVEMHKNYNYLSYLIKEISTSGGNDFDVADKITVSAFRQEKQQEIKDTDEMSANPRLKQKKPSPTHLEEEEKKKLSIIIGELQVQYGIDLPSDEMVDSLLNARSMLVKSDRLKKSAKCNSFEDFSFSFEDQVEDVLAEGYESNKKFIELLLNNRDIMTRLFFPMMRRIYDELREAK